VFGPGGGCCAPLGWYFVVVVLFVALFLVVSGWWVGTVFFGIRRHLWVVAGYIKPVGVGCGCGCLNVCVYREFGYDYYDNDNDRKLSRNICTEALGRQCMHPASPAKIDLQSTETSSRLPGSLGGLLWSRLKIHTSFSARRRPAGEDETLDGTGHNRQSSAAVIPVRLRSKAECRASWHNQIYHPGGHYGRTSR
jgi:hypothetical protein